jgi:poly(beta-D-mannuronate) C5 epimerase
MIISSTYVKTLAPKLRRLAKCCALAISATSTSLALELNAEAIPSRAEIQPDYAVESMPGEELVLPPPVLPDIDGYNTAAVRDKLQQSKSTASAPVIEIRRMFDEPALDEFVGAERTVEWAKRQHSHPKAIFIKSGLTRPDDLYRAINNTRYFDKIGERQYILRLPLVVEREATLVLEGGDSDELRMSEEHGAFLVVEGKLFLLSTRLLAWNETAATPSPFVDKYQFRPFLNSWSASELYIADSTVESLGYNRGKSYGVSVSRYNPKIHARLPLPTPKAWIIDSIFIDMYYGFYCYHANDLVIVGNTYRDNIVYGIDPHDYSRNLIIANNTVFGTKQKHGIIVSRGVDDSWIFNNRSYQNTGSGFMIDRSSTGNLLAYNESYSNNSDGITIFESADNLIWGNLVYNNKKHGVNARNSFDVRLYENKVIANGRYGVWGHIRELNDPTRDLELDPYEKTVSMTVVGGTIGANRRGSVSIDLPLSVALYDVDLRFSFTTGAVPFGGVLAEYQENILVTMIRDQRAAILRVVDERIGAN